MGLLIFTLFLRRRGFDVIYLGPSVAENDIDAVLEAANPKFLFMSCTLRENIKAAAQLADHLSSKYPFLTIGLGGSAIDSLKQPHRNLFEPFLVGRTSEEWEEWLVEKIGGV
jgi:methanogenic corrinoid protein MtbC1